MSEDSQGQPVDLDAGPSRPHEDLQGWIPELAGPEEIREALEKAFDYRGDVTITLKSGEKIEGFIFDRRAEGPSLAQCLVRMIPREGSRKITIRYHDIARLEFTGRDTAAGKTFELWMKRLREKRSRNDTGHQG
ncbi:MAG: hypothetical protein LAP85_13035 [Acidobacteriia bacterium]|nr:hypothetical protein [Terriglobia bacterium]